jgi:hypothetical protein
MEKKLSNVKPIIFSGPMVRAILEGRKTMTRRVLKPQIVCYTGIMPSFSWGKFSGLFPDDWFGHGNEIDGALPYLPGDLLYVRESWAARLDEDHIQPRDLTRSTAFFWADGPAYCCNTGCNGAAGRVRAAMHLPRRLSRLTLEVTDVRVQRVQEISEKDAEAEGIEDQKTGGLAPLWRMYGPAPKLAFGVFGNLSHDRGQFATDARDSFATLWNSINAKRGFGWDANPWVAAVTFKVHNVNVDEFLKAREAA